MTSRRTRAGRLLTGFTLIELVVVGHVEFDKWRKWVTHRPISNLARWNRDNQPHEVWTPNLDDPIWDFPLYRERK